MSDLRYTEQHEWVRPDGTAGISAYAQEQLGDVVFVDPPALGTALTQGDQAGVVESVKAASEIYAPVAGEVVEVNAALDDEPGLVNSDPTGEGWIYKLKLADAGELEGLIDEDKYAEYVGTLD